MEKLEHEIALIDIQIATLLKGNGWKWKNESQTDGKGKTN